MANTDKRLRILGIRGLPAAHGGFETFAERLALHLVQRGWLITVYCQEEGTGTVFEDQWRGIRRVRMPVATAGAAGTIVFDWRSTWHAMKEPGLVLTLGYNTAMFSIAYRLRGLRSVINMDGIEWRRQKWGAMAKAWFWLNDWAGCWLGNHLVADNPGIADHLRTRVRADKISMIPYGADALLQCLSEPVTALGLQAKNYWTVVARAEPENSILEIVSGFSRRRRGVKLAVLGKYEPATNAYHREVQEAASDEVVFLGAIYDGAVVSALRFHAIGYIHGHQVGGTNPSLVEALGAGNAVIAHDNPFNRWVAGDAARYFTGADDFATTLDGLEGRNEVLESMMAASRTRHLRALTWEVVLEQYERMLTNWLPNRS